MICINADECKFVRAALTPAGFAHKNVLANQRLPKADSSKNLHSHFAKLTQAGL